MGFSLKKVVKAAAAPIRVATKPLDVVAKAAAPVTSMVGIDASKVTSYADNLAAGKHTNSSDLKAAAVEGAKIGVGVATAGYGPVGLSLSQGALGLMALNNLSGSDSKMNVLNQAAEVYGAIQTGDTNALLNSSLVNSLGNLAEKKLKPVPKVGTSTTSSVMDSLPASVQEVATKAGGLGVYLLIGGALLVVGLIGYILFKRKK